MSPSIRLGRCFSSNSQTFSNKTFMGKSFLVSSLSFLKIKQSDCVLQFVFGLAYWKAFDSFRHYIVQGLAQMRIGTKYLLDCRSSRLVSGIFTRWALDHHHLSLGCELDYSVTQHSPLCTNCFGETLYTFYHMILFLYLLCRSYAENRISTKYKTSTSGSLHWCGAWYDIRGILALRAGGRRQLVT